MDAVADIKLQFWRIGSSEFASFESRCLGFAPRLPLIY